MLLPDGYFSGAMVFLFFIGIAFGYPLIWLNIRVAPSLSLIDWPKARGVTEDQVPLVGHSLVILTIIALLCFVQSHGVSPWMITMAIVMAVMGHFDDRRPLPPFDKLLFQVLGSAAVVYFDPHIYQAIVVKHGGWGAFWAIFFLVGLVNAVNFIDGIDGLAGIILFVGALGFLILSRGAVSQQAYQAVACIIMGGLVPFLHTNVVRRKGFLGNVGSYFLSYVLGMMHLSIPIEAEHVLPRLALSGLCFLIPIADICTVVLVRLFTSRSPFHPDRGHLHHRLVQTSLNLRHILLIFAMLETTALIVAAVMSVHPGIRNSWLPVFVIISEVVITACLILLVEKASRRRIQAYFERLENGGPLYFLKYSVRNRDGTPVSARQLYRLEARVGSEIRISDLCFTEKPDKLFVTLKVLQEPLRGISSRIEAILRSERVEIVGVPQIGEYCKVMHREPIPLRTVKGER